MSTSRPLLEAHVETLAQCGIRLRGSRVHPPYAGGPRSLLEKGTQPIQSRPVSLGEYLDRSVGTVSHPSGEAEALPLTLGRIAKADTLDHTDDAGKERPLVIGRQVIRERHRPSWSCSTSFNSAPMITAIAVSQNQSSRTTAAPRMP